MADFLQSLKQKGQIVTIGQVLLMAFGTPFLFILGASLAIFIVRLIFGVLERWGWIND